MKAAFRTIAALARAMRRQWPCALPALFAASVYRAWLLPGLLVGDDQFRFSEQLLRSYFPWRSAWDGSILFGASSAWVSPSYPLWSIVGALVRFGASFAAAERIVWFWPLLALLIAAPYSAVYRFTKSPWAAALAAALFAVNTWTVALVQRGHIGSLVAYALIPLVVVACEAWLRRSTYPRSVLIAALLTLQVMYDLRYAYVAGIACLVFAASYAARAPRASRAAVIRRLAIGAATVAVSAIVFNFFWLLPQLVAPAHLPAGYDTLAYFLGASSFESLGHSLALFTPFYHYIEGTNPFAVSPVEPVFFLLPAVAAASLVVARKSRRAVPLAVIALLGVILTSGPASPFGAIVQFAFLHVPGMKLFRDFSKFTSLVAVAFALLLGLGFARLIVLLRARFGSVRSIAASVLAVGLVAAYAVLMRDAYNPLRFSNFAAASLSRDDRRMQQFLDDQPQFFRTVLFPTWRPNLVGTDRHPLVAANYLLLNAEQDSGLGTLFAESETLEQRLASPLVPELLALASVRYVVAIEDRTGGIYVPWGYEIQYAHAIDFLRSRPWLQETAHFGRYAVFAVRVPPAPRAFIAPAPAVYDGDSSQLSALAGSELWSARAAIVTSQPNDGAVIPESLPTIKSLKQAKRANASASPSPTPDIVVGTFAVVKPTIVDAWLHAKPSEIGIDPVASALFASAHDLAREAVPTAPALAPREVVVDIHDPSIISAPFESDEPNARWFGLTAAQGRIDLVNISGEAMVANVDVLVDTPDSEERAVTATLSGVTRTTTVDGRRAGVARALGQTLEIDGVTLQPGVNVLALSAGARAAGYALLVRDDVRVARLPVSAAQPRKAALPVSVRLRSSGLELDADTDGARSAYESAAFRMLRSDPVPLDRQPRVSLDYHAPASPVGLLLSIELRRRSDGVACQLVKAVPFGATRDSIDVFAMTQAALDAAWERERIRHAGDLAWQRDIGRVRPEASEYALIAVRLIVAAPPRTPRGHYTTLLFDARLDAAPAGDVIAAVRPVDLRGTVVVPPTETVRGVHAELPLSGRMLVVNDPSRTSVTMRVPVATWPDARHLVFWTAVPDGFSTRIRLGFATSRRAATPITVDAAGRRELTDPDEPFPRDWEKDVGNPFGDRVTWRRFDIDLTQVEAYRLPTVNSGFVLNSIELTFESGGEAAPDSPSFIRIVDPMLVGSAQPQRSKTFATPGFSLDGARPTIVLWHRDPQTDSTVGDRAALALRRGSHVAVSAPPVPYRVTGVLFAPHTTHEQPTGRVDIRQVSASEYAGAAAGDGGLLVFTNAYAPGWRLAVLAPSAAQPTGNSLVDWWRLRNDFVNDDEHVTVDDAFNAWRLPAGRSSVVMLYVPDAISDAAALVWLVASLFLVAFCVFRGRP